MKRGLLYIPLFIFLISFVSAQFFSGYGRFSLEDLFYSIDPGTILLAVLFIVIFAFINMATSKIFKDPYGQPNRATAGIVAFAITALAIYGIYRSGFSFENIFYDIGFSPDSLYPVISILFLIVAAIIVWKLGFSAFLIILGLLVLTLTFFTDIYAKGIASVIGVGLLLIGLWLWNKGRKGMKAVGRGIGRGSKWVGKGAGKFAQQEWRKEKDVMRERSRKWRGYRSKREMKKAHEEALKENRERELEEVRQKQRMRTENIIRDLSQQIEYLKNQLKEYGGHDSRTIKKRIRRLEKERKKHYRILKKI